MGARKATGLGRLSGLLVHSRGGPRDCQLITGAVRGRARPRAWAHLCTRHENDQDELGMRSWDTSMCAEAKVLDSGVKLAC